MHILNEVIIVIIQAVEYMGGEVFITKRLTDRGQRVCETSHLVEVVRDAEAIKLGLPQLDAYRVSTRMRLRGKDVVKRRSSILRRRGEDDQR